MKSDLQAFSVEVKPGQSGWIQLFPAGRFTGYDGRGPFELKNPAAVIAASIRPKTDLFIDRDHQTVFMPRGTEITAAGWIKKMEAREDGVWAFVEWTEKATAQLAAKEYRYISPVFKTNPATGEVLQIMHASLTCFPCLEMTAVASADIHRSQTTQSQEEMKPMDEFVKKLAALLGLAETATGDEVVAALTERLQNLNAASAEVSDIRKTLKLDAKADAKTVLETMSALIEVGQSKKPDASEYVPMSVFNDLKGELAHLKKSQSDRDATEAVDAAMKAGKVSPGQKAWAMEYASANLTGFHKYIETAPVIVAPGSSAPQGQIETASAKPSDEVKAAWQAMGVSIEDAEKHLKIQTGTNQ
ncbi:phage protease [Micavibrio aeruginosavorus]|uniref:phage protease n=1 Tax=Micavibrio aeruginosavorus TaxID=349221 RepID=UPI003F4A933E